jgi:primosomal protein N' (replication factor Y)
MTNFAEVIVNRKSSFTDKIYHYSIPQKLSGKVKIGSQVTIPFGKRRDTGYVIGFVEKPDVKNVKDILDVESDSPLFNEDSVDLAKWMSSYYLCFTINALRAVMPPAITKKKEKRKPSGEKMVIGDALIPTEHQKNALEAILPSISGRDNETFLLFGITGSGKTEVYMQAAAHAVREGKSVIILVPEVGLTSHLVERFKSRFRDNLATLHSGMTLSERRRSWQRISSGESRIILGTRLAIFAPAKNLGLIVLDEEYEITYKQEQNPRYHAREVAKFLSERTGATLILGSATPSVESFYNAEIGNYRRIDLPERVDGKPLPPVEVIDMREEFKGKKRAVLSKKLREAIKKTLSSGEQAILFLNRRGYFTFAVCRECGTIIKCPKCSTSLNFHMSDKQLKCNHCNYSSQATIICPKCQSSQIGYLGVGTQRIEQEVAEVFPEAKIIRIDRDTTSKRGSHDVLFSAFKEGRANVLIGTQLVTKGLDVARVTLVSAVSADAGLNVPDFRAGEHTFQLLTQVAGRAGRHNLPGRVIIQTYDPENIAIKFASTHDYESFYKEEIEHRKELGYPPFRKLINIIVSGPDASKVKSASEDVGKIVTQNLKEGEKLLGPAEAAIGKVRGNVRWQLIVKGEDMKSIKKAVVESLKKVVSLSGVKVNVDVDPMSML